MRFFVVTTVLLITTGCKSSGHSSSDELSSLGAHGFKEDILMECQTVKAGKLLRIYTSNNPNDKMFLRISGGKSESSKVEYESKVVATPIDDPAYVEFTSATIAEWHFTVSSTSDGVFGLKFSGTIWKPRQNLLTKPASISIKDDNKSGQGRGYSLQDDLKACKVTDKAKFDKIMEDAGI